MRTENCETVLLNLKKYIEKIMHPNKSQAEYRQPAWAGVLSFSINTWYDVRIELYSLRRTESLVKLSVIKVWVSVFCYHSFIYHGFRKSWFLKSNAQKWYPPPVVDFCNVCMKNRDLTPAAQVTTETLNLQDILVRHL